MYYFNSKNYDNAIGDFNELLKRQPDHVSARLHRGLSNFHLEEYQYALADFSATLHYDPSNWIAYYYRGLLLRTCNSAQALRDFSISLLLNSEYDNVGAYLHRALLYCKQNQFEEAIADYEAVTFLDREHAPALCNLAIIYMQKNAQKSIQLFTRSIQADPTYVRAYFCRAYFYSQLKQYKEAYSDYTKSKRRLRTFGNDSLRHCFQSTTCSRIRTRRWSCAETCCLPWANSTWPRSASKWPRICSRCPDRRKIARRRR